MVGLGIVSTADFLPDCYLASYHAFFMCGVRLFFCGYGAVSSCFEYGGIRVLGFGGQWIILVGLGWVLDLYLELFVIE